MPGTSDMPDASDRRHASNLTSRTLSGMQWTYSAAILGAVLQIAFTAVMARLLEPAAFGLIAMAQVALRFGTYFARMGVSHALVQKAELSEEEVRAGFTSNFGLGLLFTVALWVAAPLAVYIFDEPDVVPVLQWMCLTLTATGLSGTSQALLRRELRFRALAARDLASYVIGYLGVGVAMAYFGFGVYSLVGAAVSQGLLGAVFSYAAARHPVLPVLRWEPYRALYGFGARVSVISFLEFLASNADTFAVGRFAGSAQLGHYNRAFLLVNLPLQQLTVSLTKVLFSSLSRIQREVDRLRRAYLSVIGLLAVIVIPTCAGISVAAPEIVTVVLGPQWDPARRILPILAFAAAAHMLSHVAGVLCEAAAELKAKMRLQALYLVALAAFFGLAVGRGLEAYAVAVLAGETVRHIAYLRLLRRAFDLRISLALRRYASAAFAAALVAAAVAAVRYALLTIEPPTLLLLVAQATTGGIVLVAAFRLPPLRVIRDDLWRRLQSAGLVGSGPRVVQWLVTLVLGSPRLSSHGPN